MMNRVFLLSPLLMFIFIFTFCSQKEDTSVLVESNVPDTTTIASPAPIIIVIEKEHPSSPEYVLFKENAEKRKNEILQKYPFLADRIK